jgi:hypothetical protein
MKVIGTRREPEVTDHVSGTALAVGARFSESLAVPAKSTFIPKGVYRFKAYEAMNKHQENCLARGMGDCWLSSAAVTEQITRPATLEDLKMLLRSLNANGVDYLLIGGYALAAPRRTRIESPTASAEGPARDSNVLLAVPRFGTSKGAIAHWLDGSSRSISTNRVRLDSRSRSSFDRFMCFS